MTALFRLGAWLLLTSVIAVSASLAQTPPTLSGRLDSGLHREVVAAFYDTLAQIPENNMPTRKIDLLKALMAAEKARGDQDGVRRALGEARAVGQTIKYAQVTSEIALQSYQAGDGAAAMEFIRALPDESQADALAKIAVAQIDEGKFPEAGSTAGLIIAARDKVVSNSHQPASGQQVPASLAYDYRLGTVGEAFARKGEYGRAWGLVDAMANGIHRLGLISSIAKAQYKAGDQGGADTTLQRFNDELARSPVQEAIRFEIMALGQAGHVDRARELIDKETQKKTRETHIAQLAQALSRDGQFGAASQVAGIGGEAETFVRIGWDYKNAGRDDDARAAFLAAYDFLRKRNEGAPVDRLMRVGGIVDGLISVGAFSRAVSISKAMDDLNRPRVIVKAMNEEMRRGDTTALGETVLVAIEIARAATPANGGQLPGLAVALAEAGHASDAQWILEKMTKNVDQLAGWQRLDGLRAVRAVQKTIDDKEGMARTDTLIQAEIKQFNDTLNQLASQTDDQGNKTRDAELADAMLLYRKYEAAKDKKEQEQIWQQLSPILVKHNVRLEAFVTILARYSPQVQLRDTLDRQLAEGRFDDALQTINASTDRQRDMGLKALASARNQAGNSAAAFTAVKAIANPEVRASALVEMIAPERAR